MHDLAFVDDALKWVCEVFDPILLPLRSLWKHGDNFMEPAPSQVEKTEPKPYNVADLEFLAGHGHTIVA
jgi:hypothetical protein